MEETIIKRNKEEIAQDNMSKNQIRMRNMHKQLFERARDEQEQAADGVVEAVEEIKE